MSRIKSPKKISLIVRDMCQTLGLEEAYHQYKTLQIWNSIVGEAISGATTIERFANGQLFIRVSNSSWRMELNYRKQDILIRLNASLENLKVEEIIFK